MTLRMLANAVVAAVGLTAGGVVPAVAQSAMKLHVDGVVDGRLRQPSEARLILDFGSPALNATLGQAELVSTNPSVFPVPVNLAGGQTAPVTINWPSAPAQVKVTARLRTAAGVVLGERSVEFTVLPYQAVRSIEMTPRKSRYTQGESATIRVTLMYAEPTDSFRLAMERPSVTDPASNPPYSYAGALPWRPGGTTCMLSGNLDQAGCQYPINKGTQHLDFPITVWGDDRFVSVQRTGGVTLVRPGPNARPTTVWQLATAILYRGIKQAGINQNLEPLRWTVENTIPSVTALRLDRSRVTGGDSLTGSFEIDHLGPGQGVDVRLTSDLGEVTLLPDSMRAIGGPASYTFRIATRYVSFDRTAQISARIGPANAGNAASATLRVNSLSVGLEGLNRDLFAGEVRALLLRLSQPAPGPITVTLESMDPSRLAIPQRITFRKGEQEKSIQVKAGVSVRSLATVNIRARVGSSDVLIPTRVGPVKR